jgi:hypothetical protein
VILALPCAALGAFLYRWRGGPAWFRAPTLAKRAAVAAFLAAGAFWSAAGTLAPLDAATALAGFLLAWAGVSLGHGAYYDLGATSPEKPHDRVGAYQEEPEFAWLRWFFRSGEVAGSRRAYEMVALGVTGLAATLGPGLALAVLGDLWAGLVLAAAGALKAPAYAIGWRLRSGRRATELGEYLTGAAWGLAVGLAL